MDRGLVPLAPRGPPCDLPPLPWVCSPRAGAQEWGQAMTQVPPSGHRGTGPVDGASEEATCSQRRAWGGHSACSHPPLPAASLPAFKCQQRPSPAWQGRELLHPGGCAQTHPPLRLHQPPCGATAGKPGAGRALAVPAGARGGLDPEACLTRETLGPPLPGVVQKRVSLCSGALPISKDWGVGRALLPHTSAPLLSLRLSSRSVWRGG